MNARASGNVVALCSGRAADEQGGHRAIYKPNICRPSRHVCSTSVSSQYRMLCYVLFFNYFFYHFYFPAQLVGGFTLSDLLDKPWSQVLSLLPPGTCLLFLSRIGFSIPTARRFSSNVLHDI